MANGGAHGARGQTCRDWAAPRPQPTAVRLAAAVTELFRQKEARGEHCVIEQFRRGDKEYYFAYAQDHRQISLEYAGGRMTNRPHRPAFEIIFIHDDIRRTLSIWHQGRQERVQGLQVAFAQAVLGRVIPARSPRDLRVYDLGSISGSGLYLSAEPATRHQAGGRSRDGCESRRPERMQG